MYLCSSAFILFIDWDFSLGHMTMDLPNDLAALPSPMVPSVTGTSIQVASPQGCTRGLAGPEPSDPLIYLGQHDSGGRGDLNLVPAGPTPSLGPLGIQMEAVGTLEVTNSLPLCGATETLRGFPCSSPHCPRRATIGCQGRQQCQDPSGNQPPDGWNQPVLVDGGARRHHHPTMNHAIGEMDFEVGRSGEVPNAARPEQWAPW